MRRAAKVDDNQQQIIDALKGIGATVQPLHHVGGGVPDLAVGWQGRTYMLEVKNPGQDSSHQRLTSVQAKWHAWWRGHASVVRTVEDAFRAIGAEMS